MHTASVNIGGTGSQQGELRPGIEVVVGFSEGSE